MTTDSPRIVPLEPPYEGPIGELLEKWMPPGSGVKPLALFRTLGIHQELASRMRPLGAGILGHGRVEPRLREVMIHRTCALCGAEYEWGVHVIGFGKPLGLSEEQLQATVHGSWADPCWDSEESSVFRLADELHKTSTASDELWQALSAHFDEAQIIELLVTAGWYHVISYVCNGVRVQREDWAAQFPTPASS
jgi:4-carboxymuconolactone decarboxylase